MHDLRVGPALSKGAASMAYWYACVLLTQAQARVVAADRTFMLPPIQHALLPPCTASAPAAMLHLSARLHVFWGLRSCIAVLVWCIMYREKLTRANKVWCFLCLAVAGSSRPAVGIRRSVHTAICRRLQTCFCSSLSYVAVIPYNSTSSTAAMHYNSAGMVLLLKWRVLRLACRG